MMKRVKSFVGEHAVFVYYVVTFAISWGAVLAVVGPSGIPISADQAVMVGMAVLLGPSAASVSLTGLLSGRAGLRELLTRLLRWRVAVRWYVIALLTAPFSAAAVHLLLSPFSPHFLPSIVASEDKIAFVLMGIGAGLTVGFFEELGWTGFAIHRLRLRYSLHATGLLVGLLWGAWHFILFWQRDSFSGALPLAVLLASLFSWLPAYRVLMVWVYESTESLFVVTLMHGSLTATLLTLDPALAGSRLLAFVLARAAVLWVLVAAVAVANRRRRSRQPLPTRAA